MACIPGMPCYSSTVQTQICDGAIVLTTYPRGCAPCVEQTGEIKYIGPALPNSGIQNEDTLTVALQKLDSSLSGESLVNTIIAAVQASPSLKAALCAEIGTCP
jgi:hypothetical protein